MPDLRIAKAKFASAKAMRMDADARPTCYFTFQLFALASSSQTPSLFDVGAEESDSTQAGDWAQQFVKK